MTEDYRPTCYLCNKPLNKNSREQAKKNEMPNLCFVCNLFLEKEIKNTGLKQ